MVPHSSRLPKCIFSVHFFIIITIIFHTCLPPGQVPSLFPPGWRALLLAPEDVPWAAADEAGSSQGRASPSLSWGHSFLICGISTHALTHLQVNFALLKVA